MHTKDDQPKGQTVKSAPNTGQDSKSRPAFDLEKVRY